MMYLINVLAPWLLITAAFAGLAGWAFAAGRAAPSQVAQRRDRDKLVRDLAQLAAGEATPQTAILNEADRTRSLAAIRDGRIAELERALEQARSRAGELAGEAAELQRIVQRHDAEKNELARLRGQVAAHEARSEQTIDVHVEPAPVAAVTAEAPNEETQALQAWRLRYFEQRVKFLEGRPPASASEVQAPGAEAPPTLLEQERSNHGGAAGGPDSPFAASADVDALLRWRMLYLERRLAHSQSRVEQPRQVAHAANMENPARDPDRWRWRARYLESRVRHLEERAAYTQPAPRLNGDEVESRPSPPPLVPPGSEERPPSLPAANAGAPDDFTLIEGVSPLQQSTLYSLGIYHFDQIAAWTPENVAWIDRYLRLRGRVTEEEWVEQAAELTQFGVSAVRPPGEGPRA